MNISNIAGNPDLCCGCNACVEICPSGAIRMVPDPFGQYYPAVEEDKCIGCSLCSAVCCKNGTVEQRMPQQVFAASYKNAPVSAKSSSGGIFAALAGAVLRDGGIVYGTAFNGRFDAVVTGIESADDLPVLQGSKYVRSSMGHVYREIEANLQRGRSVLFSGVPCQVAAVRSYLRRDYDKLLTVDIVCHGTPSNQMFQDYLKLLEQKKNAEIAAFYFRDKAAGQTTKGTVVYKKGRGKAGCRQSRLNAFQSSYYKLFLNCSTFREGCYSCEYAAAERVGDLTLCDYWGVDEVHPDFLKELKKTGLRGVSAVMINTERGMDLMEKIRDELIQIPTEYSQVRRYNPQLNAPSSRTPEHDEVMDLYLHGGYPAVDDYYFKKYRVKIAISTLGQVLPDRTKKKLLEIKRNFVG